MPVARLAESLELIVNVAGAELTYAVMAVGANVSRTVVRHGSTKAPKLTVKL